MVYNERLADRLRKALSHFTFYVFVDMIAKPQPCGDNLSSRWAPCKYQNFNLMVLSLGKNFGKIEVKQKAVILSAAKDLRLARREILRCAQDDTSHLAGSFPK